MLVGGRVRWVVDRIKEYRNSITDRGNSKLMVSRQRRTRLAPRTKMNDTDIFPISRNI